MLLTIVLLVCSTKLAQTLIIKKNLKELLFKFIEKYLDDPRKELEENERNRPEWH